jgi:signal transduction histidine kinase
VRSWWRRRSLRTRLVVGSVVPLGAALIVGTVALATIFAAGRVREVDAQTNKQAQVLAELAASGQLPAPLPVPAGSTSLAQIVTRNGQVLAASASASRLVPLVDAPRAGVETVERPQFGEVALRIRALPTTVSGRSGWVIVAAPLGDVRRAVRALRIVLLAVVPLLVIGATLLARLLVDSALRPVEGLRQSLQNALDQQRAFVADAAHELRSPLASMRVQLDVARRHPDAVDAAEIVDGLAPEVDRLSVLVDDLLLLARLESGAEPRRELVDLAEIAGVATPPVVVRGDPDALRRVVRNLTDNAARHAEHVQVSLAVQGDIAVLDVDDDGPGIAAEHRGDVFERWVRLDSARDRAGGGAGLGLALVREICVSHGGSVQVDDSPLGGARLRVRLPLADLSPSGATAARDVDG